MNTSNIVNAPRNIGPTDLRGVVLALLAAIGIFTLAVWGETQRIAALDGYQIQDLGPPIVGRLYSPFASLTWMMHVDTIIDASGIFRVGIRIVSSPREPSWARAAFAGERARLPWELGIACIGFLFGAIAWTRPTETSGLHGRARWASSGDIRRSMLIGNQIGVVLGEVGSKLLVHPGPQHVMVIGPPGSGKSDGIAVPTLMRTWPLSAVVFDPAGELYDRTGSYRAEGSKVFVFDPRSPKSARFNPISGMKATDIDAIQTVLAAYMLDRDLSEMSESSRFFISSALELGTALIARAIELDKHNLAGAATVYYGGGWKDDGEFCKSLMVSKVDYVKETGSKFMRMHHEVRSSVIGTLTQFLSVFRSGDVARATQESDFNAASLRSEPTTLYLIVREKDQAALNPLLRMLLTRLLDDLTVKKPEDHEQSILFLLDEFPMLRAPIIAQKLATVRKFRILMVLLAQAITQIKEYYGQYESVTGMCDVRVFYPTLDNATQEFASLTCGHATHWSESHNIDQGRRTRSVQEVGRPLLLSSELAMLGDRVLVAKKGEMPILAKPIRSYRDKRFAAPQKKKKKPAATALFFPAQTLKKAKKTISTSATQTPLALASSEDP